MNNQKGLDNEFKDLDFDLTLIKKLMKIMIKN